jgi:signal transduction histidine kinase
MRRPSLPATFRGRIALMIAVALLAVTGVQAVVREVVDVRVRASAERTLTAQAQALAETVDVAPDALKGDRAADGARFLPDTRIVVTWPGPGGVYFNLVPFREFDIRAEAVSGEVRVRLEAATPGAGLSDWAVVALFVGGLALTGALVWALASAISRRLRRRAAALAAQARAVAAGDLAARAEVTDDELGRAASAFNAMADALERADARQRRFLADVAHELRTPVTAIDGFATALADGTASTPPARDEAIAFIRDEASRLRDLIGDLRELTRLDLEPAIRPEEFDLAAAAADAAERFAPAAADAGVTLTATGDGGRVVADRGHVDTILANLVDNALRATPAGGRVDVTSSVDDGEAVLAVSDTGAGIEARHLPHIFERLYRVDDSRSREHGGSGLGLAIVARAAGLLGGGVSVDSTPGVGSAFTVRFPRTPAAALADSARDPAPTAAGDQ